MLSPKSYWAIGPRAAITDTHLSPTAACAIGLVAGIGTPLLSLAFASSPCMFIIGNRLLLLSTLQFYCLRYNSAVVVAHTTIWLSA